MARLGVAELAVVLVFGIPLAAIIGGIFLLALKILKGSSGGKGRFNAEEAKLIQELHNGFSSMEKRVETLETLLLERNE